MTARRARQLLAAESVRAQLAEHPEVAQVAVAMNEGQLRALSEVPEPQRAEVLQVAQASEPKLTARTIKRAKAIVIDGATGEPEPAPERHTCAACGWKGWTV